KVQQAADIYSKLELAPGYYVNGEISTGEIIADLGGLTVAIDIAQKKVYDTKKVLESYGKALREVTTKEFAIANISDENPPAKYR
ncbi:M13 family peptidase, partial [Streptococcus suis]